MPIDENDFFMSDDELIELALYKVLDKNVENLQTQIKLWLKKENDGEYPDAELYTERLRKLTKTLRGTCDQIDGYAEKLDANFSKQTSGE